MVWEVECVYISMHQAPQLEKESRTEREKDNGDSQEPLCGQFYKLSASNSTHRVTC